MDIKCTKEISIFTLLVYLFLEIILSASFVVFFARLINANFFLQTRFDIYPTPVLAELTYARDAMFSNCCVFPS